MKKGKPQARRNRVDSRPAETTKEIAMRLSAPGDREALRKAELNRNLRSITKRLDALIAYVNRPPSASR
jgi:hypothetical protein